MTFALRVAVVLALLGVTLAVFLPVTRAGFVNFDDDLYVYRNDQVRRGLTWRGAAWAFTSVGYAGNWHPLTWLSHMLDVELFGLDAGGHHLVNLLMHLVNTLLLCLVLAGATGSFWPSLAVSAGFALHPLHVESVAWVSERKDTLAAFFWLAAMLAYRRHAARPGAGRYAGVLVLMAMGLMAKPTLVTLPLVLLLWDYWPLGMMTGRGSRTWRSLAAAKLPLLLLSAASAAVTLAAQKGSMIAPTVFPWGTRLAVVPARYLWYLVKGAWPAGLAVFYPLERAAPSGPWLAAAAVLSALLTWLALRPGTPPWLTVGTLWYIGTLAPVIGLVQVGGQSTADRYAYLPLVGLFIILAWEGAGLARRSAALGMSVATAAGGIMAVFAVLTARQVGYWENSIVLFTRAAAVTRDNYLAYGNLGQAYAEQGRLAEAVDPYRRAAMIKPGLAGYRYNLGTVYYALGRYAEAAEAMAETVRLNPRYAQAYFYLGRSYGMLGRRREAIGALTRAYALVPGFADMPYNLGKAYYNVGRYREAASFFLEALALKPDLAEARLELGLAYGRMGRTGEAVAALRASAAAQPASAETLYYMGVALEEDSAPAEAAAAYRRALDLRPDYPEARGRLADLERGAQPGEPRR